MEGYKIIMDSREKEVYHITGKFLPNKIPYDVKALTTGDYRIEVDGYSPNVVIERKASLDELVANLVGEKDEYGYTRLHRELERASKANTKLIILIEEEDWYSKLIRGDYQSKVHKNSIKGMLVSLQAKYPNVFITGVNKEDSASYIHSLLYYELRERMKSSEEAN